MLYLSTRNKADSYTAYRVLHADVTDAGMFMPMNLPVQDDVALAEFAQMSFGMATATVLNLFFGTHISGWDVDFAVGRQALDLVSAGYKISLAESWHNSAGTHEYLVKRLFCLVRGEKFTTDVPNAWFETVVDIAILFSLYGKFARQEIYEFDIAVETGNLEQLLAIRYAQKMGLPVRKVLLGCIDGDGLWELVSHGNYQNSKKEPVMGLEPLLWLEFGYNEVQKYRAAIAGKLPYRLTELKFEQFRSGLFASVVGDSRAKNIIDSTIRTNNYQMQSSTARAFGALQDYRAKTGINKNTLLFARNAPTG